MDHRFSEFQEMLGQTARDFFSREYPLDRMRDIYRGPGGYDEGLWRQMLELGWTAAPFPEAIGGMEGSLLDVALLLEEMGKGAAVSPFNHTIAAGLALTEAAPEVATQVAGGEAVVIAAPARVPNGGSALPSLQGSTLSGRLLAVPWANVATHFLVPLAGGNSALVEAGQGVTSKELETAGGDHLFEVTLDGAPAREVGGPEVQQRVTAFGAAINATIMLGLCQRSLQLASDYAKERIQFGKPIGTYQAISHKCANMVVDIEVGRNLCYKAAWLQQQGRPFEQAARYAKAFLGDATARVTRDAIQVHGGVGFIDNHLVQLPYVIGVSMASEYGTAHEHRKAIADAVLGARNGQ